MYKRIHKITKPCAATIRFVPVRPITHDAAHIHPLPPLPLQKVGFVTRSRSCARVVIVVLDVVVVFAVVESESSSRSTSKRYVRHSSSSSSSVTTISPHTMLALQHCSSATQNRRVERAAPMKPLIYPFSTSGTRPDATTRSPIRACEHSSRQRSPHTPSPLSCCSPFQPSPQSPSNWCEHAIRNRIAHPPASSLTPIDHPIPKPLITRSHHTEHSVIHKHFRTPTQHTDAIHTKCIDAICSTVRIHKHTLSVHAGVSSMVNIPSLVQW